MKDCTSVQSGSSNDSGSNSKNSTVSDHLRREESKIRNWQQSKVAAGRAMRRIGEEKLHRERCYSNVEDYAEDHFGISESRWYQLVRHAETYDVLEERLGEESPLPQNEAQTRPLNDLRENPQALITVWTRVTDRYGENLSQGKVRAVLEQMKSDSSQETSADPDPQANTGRDVPDWLGGEKDPDGTTSSTGSGEENSSSPDDSENGAPDESPDEHSEDDAAEGNPDVNTDSTSSPGSRKQLEGAYVKLPDDIVRRLGLGDPPEDPSLIAWEAMGKSELDESISMVDTEEKSLGKSSGDQRVARSVWRPVELPPSTFTGGLPEEDPDVVVFQPKQIGRLSSPRVSYKADRVLVCPGLDLFAPVVPDHFIQTVIESLEGVEVTPVVFTRHLRRAKEFSFPADVAVGTPVGRDTIEKKTSELQEIDASPRWVLFDVDRKQDKPPAIPERVDWIVYDPPGGAGVSLDIDQIRVLIKAAEESGAAWTFRRSFKTFGASPFPG